MVLKIEDAWWHCLDAPRKGSPPSSGSQVFVGSFVVREHLHALPLEAIWVRLIAER